MHICHPSQSKSDGCYTITWFSHKIYHARASRHVPNCQQRKSKRNDETNNTKGNNRPMSTDLFYQLDIYSFRITAIIDL